MLHGMQHGMQHGMLRGMLRGVLHGMLRGMLHVAWYPVWLCCVPFIHRRMQHSVLHSTVYEYIQLIMQHAVSSNGS